MLGGSITQYFKARALGRAPSCVHKALQGSRKGKRGTQSQMRANSTGGNAAAHCLLEQFDLALVLSATSTPLLPVLGESASSPFLFPVQGPL